MRTLRLMFATLMLLGFTSAAHAEFGIGVFGSYHASDSYTFTGANADKINPKGGSNYGALLFMPVLPFFSLRAGVAYETIKSESVYTGGSTVTSTLTNTLVPVNLHFEFPITGLYAFGGMVFVSNTKTDPDTAGKAGSDTRTNVGVGYDFFSLPLFTISAEAEMQKGSKNISPDPAYDIKSNHMNVNIMARFTL